VAATNAVFFGILSGQVTEFRGSSQMESSQYSRGQLLFMQGGIEEKRPGKIFLA